ncbi:MAG: LPP20 family lipoprotein, partial [Smithellaceae bacterium]|nr:LPP20 family lipoprotein [Smithellaceae bacterium]
MTLKGSITTVLLTAILLFPGGTAVGQDSVSAGQWTQLVEQMGNMGNINWSAGYIEAVGIGAPPAQYMGKPQARPMALRAAQVDALRNLLEITKGVRVDSATSVSDFTVTSDVINTQVEGVVKGAKVMKQEYMSDGTVEVTVRMSLGGNLAPIIMPRVLDRKPETPPPALAPPTAPPAIAPQTAEVVYTGVVIDARGIQVRPAMSPRIIDET